jgi:hypothetical protein
MQRMLEAMLETIRRIDGVDFTLFQKELVNAFISLYQMDPRTTTDLLEKQTDTLISPEMKQSILAAKHAPSVMSIVPAALGWFAASTGLAPDPVGRDLFFVLVQLLAREDKSLSDALIKMLRFMLGIRDYSDLANSYAREKEGYIPTN